MKQRDHLFNKTITADVRFRWRGGDVSRPEAFADGIFALTITLLIVSISQDYGFYDLWLMVRDLPAFLLSFAMICYAWVEHYRFFRRYGLADGVTLFLNAWFLFLVMILAYPLKLLSLFLWHLIISEPNAPLFAFPADANDVFTEFEQRIYMMYFYGLAIMGVFGTLLLMHINALAKRALLELDEMEQLATTQSIAAHSVTCLIAGISCFTLYVTQNPGVSGVVYFSMPFAHAGLAIYFQTKYKNLMS